MSFTPDRRAALAVIGVGALMYTVLFLALQRGDAALTLPPGDQYTRGLV